MFNQKLLILTCEGIHIYIHTTSQNYIPQRLKPLKITKRYITTPSTTSYNKYTHIHQNKLEQKYYCRVLQKSGPRNILWSCMELKYKTRYLRWRPFHQEYKKCVFCRTQQLCLYYDLQFFTVCAHHKSLILLVLWNGLVAKQQVKVFSKT